MRRTLLDILDSGELDAAALPIAPKTKPMGVEKPPVGGKPAVGGGKPGKPTVNKQDVKKQAQSLKDTIDDTIGETSDSFEDMAKKRLEYELSKEQAKRKLLPVQTVLQHVDQMHELSGPRPTMSSNPDEAMGYTEDPNVEPGSMGPRPLPGMNQKPGGPLQQANPQNSRMAPGASPRIPGGKPGAAAPASAKQVGPPKMGVPKPGTAKPATQAGNPSKGKIKVEVNSGAVTKFSYKFGKRPKGLRAMENAAMHEKLMTPKGR